MDLKRSPIIGWRRFKPLSLRWKCSFRFCGSHRFVCFGPRLVNVGGALAEGGATGAARGGLPGALGQAFLKTAPVVAEEGYGLGKEIGEEIPQENVNRLYDRFLEFFSPGRKAYITGPSRPPDPPEPIPDNGEGFNSGTGGDFDTEPEPAPAPQPSPGGAGKGGGRGRGPWKGETHHDRIAELLNPDQYEIHGDPIGWKFLFTKPVPATGIGFPPGTKKVYEVYLDENGWQVGIHYHHNPDGTKSGERFVYPETTSR